MKKTVYLKDIGMVTKMAVMLVMKMVVMLDWMKGHWKDGMLGILLDLK